MLQICSDAICKPLLLIFKQTFTTSVFPSELKKGNIVPCCKKDNKQNLKVGLSPSKKICFIFLIESPLKMIKNGFYFILKAVFVLKIFKFLSRPLGYVGKRA